MRITIRDFVKELLENESLLVSYNELGNGGFDLSVRVNEELAGQACCEPEKVACPYCSSTRVKSLYGTINCDGSNNRIHYICEDCHKEFDV